ncbi:MAG: Nif3-like dinuclear metal center hexameric protein, partial [Muribaculaceae bacterium]|nr:Nif3-like dinuclear metal center hexameric protein [Muribaculaceae bacterium]
MKITKAEIIKTLEQVAPPRLQEGFDNTGLQCGTLSDACTGVVLCIDATAQIVNEAIERGCNLIITHHPLLFKPVKRITGEGRVQAALVKAIRNNITIYSSHTSLDNAPGGISHVMARKLDMHDVTVLEDKYDENLGPVGSGVIGFLPEALTPMQLIERVKKAFGSPIVRCSDPMVLACQSIQRVALCGGAGSFLMDRAIELGAQAFITSDSKFNLFLDCLPLIFLIDIGHYESEECAKEIFYHVIKEKFPNFAIYNSQVER